MLLGEAYKYLKAIKHALLSILRICYFYTTPPPPNALQKIRKESSKISVWCIYSFKNIVTESESNFSKTTLGYIREAFIEDFV